MSNRLTNSGRMKKKQFNCAIIVGISLVALVGLELTWLLVYGISESFLVRIIKKEFPLKGRVHRTAKNVRTRLFLKTKAIVRTTNSSHCANTEKFIF